MEIDHYCIKCGQMNMRSLVFLQDWPFDDGTAPPSQLIDDWFNLLRSRFKEDPGCCVAVHCVAGLGRPVNLN